MDIKPRPLTPRDMDNYRREIGPIIDHKAKLISMFARPSYVVSLESGLGHMEIDMPEEIRLVLNQFDELIALIARRYSASA